MSEGEAERFAREMQRAGREVCRVLGLCVECGGDLVAGVCETCRAEMVRDERDFDRQGGSREVR